MFVTTDRAIGNPLQHPAAQSNASTYVAGMEEDYDKTVMSAGILLSADYFDPLFKSAFCKFFLPFECFI
jgi:hypothetical protein